MKRLAIILILLFIVALPATIIMAQGVDGVISEGDIVDHDLTVFSDLEIQSGATVNGDVTVWGGSNAFAGTISGDISVYGGHTVIEGHVDGDLVLFGGQVDVTETAEIDGDCIQIGGNVDVAEGSALVCNRADDFSALPLPNFAFPSAPPTPRPPDGLYSVGRFLAGVGAAIGGSLMLGLAALVITSLWPHRFEQVQAVVKEKPVVSGMVGLLTAVAVPSLAALLSLVSFPLLLACGLGLLGYTAVFVMVVALAAAALVGWVALGELLGRWLAARLNLSNRSLPMTAALGTVSLTLAVGVLGLLPFVCGESILVALMVCVGLGAVALTRFGTQPYPPQP